LKTRAVGLHSHLCYQIIAALGKLLQFSHFQIKISLPRRSQGSVLHLPYAWGPCSGHETAPCSNAFCSCVGTSSGRAGWSMAQLGAPCPLQTKAMERKEFGCLSLTLPPFHLPQIQYNGLNVDVDGRTTKKLITNLKPRTFYNFVLMNRGNSMGGLQQNVAAWTAADMLSKKPEVTHKPDADGNVVVILPDVKSSVPVQ